MTMTSSDFRSSVEPVLNHIFDGIYKQKPEEWRQVFETDPNPIKRRYHEEPVFYGFGLAPNKPEGEPIVYDEGGEQYRARYFYQEYALAFALTRALRDDSEMFPVAQRMSKHLAISMRQTKEQIGADIFNRAFNSSYVGGDGVSLISTSHPLASGGTQSNQASTTALLSEASLEQLITQVRLAVDGRGKFIELSPDKLVVAPANTYNAGRILKSVLRSGTGNNDANIVKDMGWVPGGIAQMTRLTNTNAWFLTTDAPEGLKYLERVGMETGSEGDFETDNMRYKAYMRFAMGWTDYLGLFGNQGV